MTVSDLLKFLKENHELANAISATASVAVAFLALLISVLSLFFTWRTLKHQRIHNRQSVRPLPYITVGDYDNLVYVKIRNNGTGPLIVKRLTVPGAVDQSAPLVDNMPELQPGVSWTHFVGPTDGRSIPVGGEMILLELSDQNLDQNFRCSRDQVRKALGGLSLNLDYTDIYGSSFPACSRDLKWFHRTLAPIDQLRQAS